MQKTTTHNNVSRGVMSLAGFFVGRMNRMTIGNKIAFMYGGIFAIGLIFISVFLLGNVTYIYRRASLKELDQTAAEIAAYIESGGVITQQTLERINTNKYVEVVITPTDANRHDMSQPILTFPFTIPFTNEDFQRSHARPGQTVKIRSVNYMFSEKLAQYKSQTYLIHVYRNYQSEQEILHLFQIIFLALDVLGVCAAFLLGRYFSRLTLRPIIRVITTAERISIEDLTRRIEVSGPNDEIRQLTITFNDMITRLETSFRRQTQFVSDASHELRTPISVIQGYANLMDRWGKRDPAVLQESIDSIKAETEHMSMLVKKLLFMAKTDHRTIQIQKQPLSLQHVAEEVIREMSVLGVRQSVELITQGDDCIQGDYDLIKQMFWIFLENAIKYSKSIDGKIQISITDEANRRCVHFKDEGIGIGRDDLPYIFERFYRADKSRSSEVPGNGLGLSIAAWILKQHEASIEVNSELDRGTEIIIRFPNI